MDEKQPFVRITLVGYGLGAESFDNLMNFAEAIKAVAHRRTPGHRWMVELAQTTRDGPRGAEDGGARAMLLPCPFCGAKSGSMFGPVHDDYLAYPEHHIPEMHTVTCLKCHCYGPLGDTHDEAGKKWNHYAKRKKGRKGQ